jgi:iron(III) transport system substrate-binding protein
MKHKSLIITAFASIFFLGLVPGNLQAADTISAYMGTSPENNLKIVNFIKDKTGITINQTFQSFGEIEARVKAEAPNFNADMVVGCGSPLAFMAKKNGWSVPYVSEAWKGTSDIFMDPEGFWYNFSNFSFVLVGNKDRLAKAGYSMPKSWKDLLDPKWKNEIVMPSPLSSGTANMMRYTFLALYGDDEGWKFLTDLDKNIHHYTRSGNAPTDLVGRGEFMLGITSDENVKKRLDDGYPILWTVPEEGTGYDGTFAFILKGTKNLDVTKKVIDVLGTKEFSAVMADIGYVTPQPAPNKLYGDTLPKFVKIDLAKAAEDRPKNNEIWKQKFRTEAK